MFNIFYLYFFLHVLDFFDLVPQVRENKVKHPFCQMRRQDDKMSRIFDKSLLWGNWGWIMSVAHDISVSFQDKLKW